MKKRHLTKEEKEDIRIVMEATQKLLPFYEQLTAADQLNEEEQQMLEQIRQTLHDVLEYSGMMMDQINLLQFESALDTLFIDQQQTRQGNSSILSADPGAHQSYVEYLKDSINEQLN